METALVAVAGGYIETEGKGSVIDFQTDNVLICQVLGILPQNIETHICNDSIIPYTTALNV